MPAPESHQYPLSFALHYSTSKHSHERPYYMLYNFLFAAHNNSGPDGKLFTSPEFHVIADGDDDDATDSSYTEKSPSKGRQTKHLELANLAPLLPFSKNLRSRAQDPKISPTTPPPAKHGNWADLMVAFDEEQSAPGSSETARTIPYRLGYDRSRIVDFAIVHLKAEEDAIETLLLGFKAIPLSTFVPIIVEGKCAPSRRLATNDALLNQLRIILADAESDIMKKKGIFFNLYPCYSLIAIIFAGPFWSFSICSPNPDHLKWSKAFRVGTKAHSNALQKIFEAAKQSPENPGQHPDVTPLAKSNQVLSRLQINESGRE